ncbi:MAG: hypothetical protein AB1758_27540 [Candidatus Eremiobacterota bacterium]
MKDHPLVGLLVAMLDSYRAGRIGASDLAVGLEVMLERLEQWSARLEDPDLAPAGGVLERQKAGILLLSEAVEGVRRFAVDGPGERLEVALLEAQRALDLLESD